MGTPKWLKEARNKWREEEVLNPTLHVERWNEKQMSDANKMANAINKFKYQYSQDVKTVIEILSYSHLLHGCSIRIVDLNQKVSHYMSLKQRAAKDKLWGKIVSLVYCLDTELAHLKNEMERRGIIPQ